MIKNFDFLIEFLGLGILLFIVGLIFFIRDKKKQKSCIATIRGHVVGFNFVQDIPRAVVEYTVDGQTYKDYKHFRGISYITKGLSLNSLNYNDYEIYLDEDDIIHVKKQMIMNMKEAMAKICPLGTSYQVFYNPRKPSQAYVEKVPGGFSIIGVIYMILGVVINIIGVIIANLISK